MLEVLDEWKDVIGWLAVATYAKYVLRWSVSEISTALLKEVRDTAKMKPTKAGINGLVVSLATVTGILLALAPTLGRFAGVLNNDVTVPVNLNILFMGIVTLGITSLVGVLRG